MRWTDFKCAKCRGRMDGNRCTDCASAYTAQVRDDCAWDHAVLMWDLTMKIMLKEKQGDGQT